MKKTHEKCTLKLSYIVHVGQKRLLLVVKAGEIQSPNHALVKKLSFVQYACIRLLNYLKVY